MTSNALAQHLFDKAMSVTVRTRHDEVRKVFANNGFVLGPDDATVVSIRGDPQDTFSTFYASLGGLPTVKLVAKRILAANDITV